VFALINTFGPIVSKQPTQKQQIHLLGFNKLVKSILYQLAQDIKEYEAGFNK